MSINNLKRHLEDTTTKPDSESGLSTTVLIGIIVGGIGIIAIIIIISYILIKRKRKSKIIQKEQINKIIAQDIMKEPHSNKKLEAEISQSRRTVINVNQIHNDHTTDIISQRSMDITNRTLYEKKKYEADSYSKNSMKPVIDNKSDEKFFKKSIDLIDSNDDKLKDLVMHLPKYIPNKNFNIEMYENKVEEKTIKDIITNNIYNYTDGNREDFYTEGSKRSYVSSVASMPREIQIAKRNSVEKEMTPEEHSDFMDGEDFFNNDDGIIKVDQYNSEYIPKRKLADKPEVTVGKKFSLS
jgi:hypothetical protein